MMNFRLIIGIVLLSLNVFAIKSHALNLEQFLSEVQSRNKLAKSYKTAIDAATYRKESGDIALATALSLQGSSIDDSKPNATMPYYMITHTLGTTYSLGLTKQFSSGTQVALTSSISDMSMNASDSIATPGSTIYTKQEVGTGALGISLSQSLWKDFFGRSTRLRHERESYTESLEKTSADLQYKQLMIDAESSYWDYLYLQDELSLRKDSLERAQKIASWIGRRVNNGIGDQSDLLNAKGLVAARELQLLTTEDDLVAMKKKILDYLELPSEKEMPTIEGNIEKPRELKAMVEGQGRRILRLDSLMSVLEAKAKKIGSYEAAEAMRPDLVLSGAYSTNSFDPTNGMSGVVNKLTDTSIPTSAVALKFSWLFDGDVKNATREAARMDALAASLKKDQKLVESDTSWSEIQRRHSELTKKIEFAKKMDEIRRKRALVEKDKLSKGRTITSDVITAEQDAGESALTLIKLQTEQRKLESQAKIFIATEATTEVEL